MRPPAKRVKPGPHLSDDGADKIWASLFYDTAEQGRAGKNPHYVEAPRYWDSVEEWFRGLNDDQLETVDLIRDTWFQFPVRQSSILRHWTRDLPSARRCRRRRRKSRLAGACIDSCQRHGSPRN